MLNCLIHELKERIVDSLCFRGFASRGFSLPRTRKCITSKCCSKNKSVLASNSSKVKIITLKNDPKKSVTVSISSFQNKNYPGARENKLYIFSLFNHNTLDLFAGNEYLQMSKRQKYKYAYEVF